MNKKNKFNLITKLFGKKTPNIEYTPGVISLLKDNEIFVFGSNTQGVHAGGAAKYALSNFGAVMGQDKGLQGNSYAISTISYTSKRKYPKLYIYNQVLTFSKFAATNPRLKFYVTLIGTGIAGFTLDEMATIFKEVNKEFTFPSNVILPVEFECRYGEKD